MTNFIKELINQRLKQITTEELLTYAEEYHFFITKEEAESILHYFRMNSIDPFDQEDQAKFFKKLGEITNYQTARKAQNLFFTLIKKYNLGHLFRD